MKLIAFLVVFAGALFAQNPSPCTQVRNAAVAGQVLSAATSGRPPQCQWITGGGGGGGVSQVTGTLPIQVANTTTTPVVSCRTATGSVSGCITAADWTTFNSKAASNAATTVNSQTCALGSSCTVTVPIATGVTGLGTGIATWLATPSGANLATALTTPLTTTGGGLGAALNGAAAHSTVISNGATPAVYSAKVIPDCTDTGGNHLNFTQSTDAFSCGTGGGGATHSVDRFLFTCDQGGGQVGDTAITIDSGSPSAATCGAAFRPFASSVLHNGADEGWRTVFFLTGWDGSSSLGITIYFEGNTTANGTVQFGVSTSCYSPGTSDVFTLPPTYNTEQTVTVNEGTVALILHTATIASLTTTGCAANRPIVVRILRKNAGTSTDGIYFLGASFTY